MDIRRIISYMALALVSLSLWNAWQIDYPPKRATAESSITQKNSAEPLLPQVNDASSSSTAPITPSGMQSETQPASLVQVKTDVLDVAIDLQHGDVVSG